MHHIHAPHTCTTHKYHVAYVCVLSIQYTILSQTTYTFFKSYIILCSLIIKQFRQILISSLAISLTLLLLPSHTEDSSRTSLVSPINLPASVPSVLSPVFLHCMIYIILVSLLPSEYIFLFLPSQSNFKQNLQSKHYGTPYVHLMKVHISKAWYTIV